MFLDTVASVPTQAARWVKRAPVEEELATNVIMISCDLSMDKDALAAFLVATPPRLLASGHLPFAG